MTTASKAIRNALKAEGYTSRMVSVRQASGSVRVEIKDADIDFASVKDIAESFESIRRCEVTQEILRGGNTFVFVSYANDATLERCERVDGAVWEAIAKLDNDRTIEKISGTNWGVSKTSNGYGGDYTAWGEDGPRSAWSVSELVRIVAGV